MAEIKRQNMIHRKHEILNTKQYRSTSDKNSKQYDNVVAQFIGQLCLMNQATTAENTR